MDTLTVQVWKLDFSEFKSPAAKLVALALARFGHYTGQVLVKQARIGEICGISKQTVGRCLDELEERHWINREPRRRRDGSMGADIIWLTLPAVTLDGTTVDPKEAARLDAMDLETGTTVVQPVTTVDAHQLPGSAAPGARVTTQNESPNIEKGMNSPAGADPLPPDVATAVDLIWQRASKVGRGRSSKADIETALRAALARGHAMERILRGLGGYFASDDATKDDGAYQRGAHVMLAKDRWASFLDDVEARTAAGEDVDPAAAAVTEDLGTLEQPTPKRQRVWMDLFSKGMPWPADRGPQPGRAGCRVDPALQLEFGVEPWTPPPPSGDDAAFD